MSSNINIQRICGWCGKTFTARKTVTMYCSHKCNNLAYKDNIRKSKIENSNQEIENRKGIDPEKLKSNEFLTVKQAAQLLNSSFRTIYRMIDRGKIKAFNISERKTLIRKSDIEDLFNSQKSDMETKEEQAGSTARNQITPFEGQIINSHVDLLDMYSLSEIREKFKVSDKALSEIANRFNIPKTKIGWYVYMPKILIDRVFNLNNTQDDC